MQGETRTVNIICFITDLITLPLTDLDTSVPRFTLRKHGYSFTFYPKMNRVSLAKYSDGMVTCLIIFFHFHLLENERISSGG